MSDCVQSSCNFLLQSVRNSGLNFSCQETPFSIFLTIRKSLVKSFQFQSHRNPSYASEIEDKFDVKSYLIEENKSLKEAFNKLKNEFEAALSECESKNTENEDLKATIEILHEKLSTEENNNVKIEDLEANIKHIKDDKKTSEDKSENVSKENKTLKKELGELNNQIKALNKDLKAAIKEKRDVAHDFEKKIDILENRNKTLLEYKRTKEAESKDLKVQLKNVNKRAKEISEKEAKLELNKINLEKLKNEKGDKKKRTDFKSVSTQADLEKSLSDYTNTTNSHFPLSHLTPHLLTGHHQLPIHGRSHGFQA